MDNFKTFGFTEDQFNRLINQKPRSGGTSVTNNTGHEQLVKILNLKKKLIRTELHADFLIEYLKAGVIPIGLQIRNEPGLFIENKKFLEVWSHIANRCSRDWLILIIETAQEIMILERKQLEELEALFKQNTVLEEAKKKIEELDLESNGYREYLINKKTKTLRKDIERFSAESVYPFLGKEYYTTRRDQRWEKPQPHRPIYSRGGNKRITFSETSGSSSEEEQVSEQGGRSISTYERDSFLGGRQNRGQRGYRNYNREEPMRNHPPQNRSAQDYLKTRNQRYWR